jgi:hypothetical protein
MDEKDKLMFFAGMALVGLVLRGESPDNAAKMAREYAEAMLKQDQ